MLIKQRETNQVKKLATILLMSSLYTISLLYILLSFAESMNNCQTVPFNHSISCHDHNPQSCYCRCKGHD